MKNIKTRFSKFINTVSPVKFFAVTAVVFGLLFIAITPPFQTPDETVHFLRAYHITEFNIVPDEVGEKTGGYLPKSLGETIAHTMTRPNIQFNSDQKYDIYKTSTVFSLDTRPDDKQFYDFSTTSYYPPIPYLPQSIGIGIARLLDLSPLAMMYLGRIVNLILWVILMALSIKLLPRRKWVLAAIGLLPMAIFLGISLSTDVMTFGLTALMVALILKLREQANQISNKQILLLLILLSALVLSKQVMFVFLPIVLLLPNKILGRKAWLKKLMLILVPLILFAAWMVSVKDIGAISNPINQQNPVAQTHFITHNPHSYINVLWNTNFYHWSDSITRSFIGVFGWQDAPISELWMLFGYLTLAFLMLVSYGPNKKWLDSWQKWLLFLIGVVYWLAVSTALYVYYSPVGYKIIVGLQGRYFLPLAILAIPLLYGVQIRSTKSTYKKVAVLFPLILLIASTITLYVRYYVKNV